MRRGEFSRASVVSSFLLLSLSLLPVLARKELILSMVGLGVMGKKKERPLRSTRCSKVSELESS